MATGKVHDKITLYLILPVFAINLLVLKDNISSLICTLSFLFAGLMFGPDLDTFSHQYKRWGFLRFLWIPYQKFGGHRSFLNQSHDALFGPVFRLCYLGLLWLIFAWLSWHFFNFNLNLVLFWLQKYLELSLLQLLILFFVGTWLGSLSHQATDWFYYVQGWYEEHRSKRKRRRKSKRMFAFG
jgi:uncharacterized metal-binding protein